MPIGARYNARMYVIAVIADLVGLIPIINWVSDAIAAIVLGLMGSAGGISLYRDSEVGMTLFTIVLKAIPFIDIVPMWTIRVYLAKQGAKKRMQQEQAAAAEAAVRFRKR